MGQAQHDAIKSTNEQAIDRYSTLINLCIESCRRGGKHKVTVKRWNWIGRVVELWK